MSRGTGIALAVLLVAAAGPAGFLTYRLLLARHWVPEPSERQITAVTPSPGPSAKPPPEDATAASSPDTAAASASVPSIPEVLPDLTFPDSQGTTRKLSDWRGRPLLVNFWATWCEPCRREIPLLKSLLRGHEAGDLEVVGIAVDDRDPVLKYASTMKIDYPVLIGGEDGGLKAINALGMAGVLPFTVFADTRGRILTVKVGELHPDEAHLILARLLDVDAGRLTLAVARKQIEAGLEALAVQRAKGSASASSPAKS